MSTAIVASPPRGATVIRHRATAVIAALVVLATGCAGSDGTTAPPRPTTGPQDTSEPATTLPFSPGPVDWDDRSSVDIDLPTGWHLAACDGDAPFLCASTADGTIDGTIMLVEYPAPASAASRDDVDAEANELYRVTEEDRRSTCGTDYHLEADTLSEVIVGGKAGYRFGYQLKDEGGDVTERVILHVVDDGPRRIVINTAFSDPNACPGEDPERNEFPIGALAAIDPYIDGLVAQSILPVGTGPR